MAILHNLDLARFSQTRIGTLVELSPLLLLAVFATFHRRNKTFFLLLYDLHELFVCLRLRFCSFVV